MFLLNILEAVLAYDLVKIRFIKEKEVILNGNTNDKSRGIQLIRPGDLQKVIKEVNWLLSPITCIDTSLSSQMNFNSRISIVRSLGVQKRVFRLNIAL